MKSKILSLDRLYKRIGCKLCNGEVTLLKLERIKPTKKKAKDYLLYTDSQTKKPIYISSLYPLSGGSYHFDYNGAKYYYIELEDNTIKIEAL